MGIRHRYAKMPIKYKVMILIFVITIISLSIFASAITFSYQNSILERSETHIEQNIEIMAERIDAIFVDAELCSNNLVIDISNVLNSNELYNNKESYILSHMTQNAVIFNGIASIVYVDVDGKFYTTDVTMAEYEDEIVNSAYINMAKSQNNSTVLYDPSDNDMECENFQNVVTLGKKAVNILTGKTMGYILINVELDYLGKFMQNQISEYALYDSTNNVVVNFASEEMAELDLINKLSTVDIHQESYNYEKYLALSSTVEYGNWQIIGVTSLSEFSISGVELAVIILSIGLVVLLFVICISNYLANIISNPILKLTKGAQSIAEGNLNTYLDIDSQDEIGNLGENFNIMSKKVEGLIDKVNEEAKKKREYELALVHEQVKPHFLYNTLDIVIMLIEMDRSKDAQYATKKLASYYKNALSDRKETITLKKEFEILEDYLELQMIRYGNLFKYSIEFGEEIQNIKVPRMLLQPLVENAIYHGLKYKENWGKIQIYTQKVASDVLIYIKDDGIGMSEETLMSVMKKDDGELRSFGIFSVDKRLKLYYGENYGISIASEYKKGTCVTVKIPMNIEGESND